MDILDVFKNADPSKNKKYLRWMLNQNSSGDYYSSKIIETIQLFDKYSYKLTVRDIYQYKTIQEVNQAINNIDFSSSKEKRLEIKRGAKKIYHSKSLLLLRLDTKESARLYGKNSQWCITSGDDETYDNWSDSGSVFYVLVDRSKTVENCYHKLALVIDRKEYRGNVTYSRRAIQIFDQEDCEVSRAGFRNVNPKADFIMGLIRKNSIKAPVRTLFKITNNMLSERQILGLINHKQYEVRLQVAAKINERHLIKMIHDEDGCIRSTVADLIPKNQLVKMMADKVYYVRKAVAHRIDEKYLRKMLAAENNDYVKRVINDRLSKLAASK